MFGLEDELQDDIIKLGRIISTQKELITILENQIVDLTVMSKIELGDDVIEEIKRLKEIINKDEQRKKHIRNT